MKRFLTLLMVVSLASALQAQSLVVNTFDKEFHEAGAHINKSFTFPADNSIYDSISMKIALTCPTIGCDPWDRFANIKVVSGGQTIEIGRFVTPYANGWCDWALDVSDYRNYLEGSVELISHIDTWEKGWDLTVDFEFFTGTPDYEYVGVTNLWTDYEFLYGDTLFYSIDLPEKVYAIPSNSQKVVLRINNTGHGQGNTDNAAEFSQKTHHIKINGSIEFSQYLWKADCASNPCSPQSGTWVFNRAGWCPGQEVVPWDYNITSLTAPGQAVYLDYVLQPYFNQCSPFNPGCNPTICDPCTYNSNTHTRPIYKIAAQVLVYSDTPIITSVDRAKTIDDIELYPNPSSGSMFIDFKQLIVKNTDINILDMKGSVVYEKRSKSKTGTEELDLKHLDNGIYIINIVSESISLNQKIIILK